MNKLQFNEYLAARLGIMHSEAERFTREFIDLIYDTLKSGESVNLSGFGRFSVSHRHSRIGVNPRPPYKQMVIPALNTPKFKAGEAFKQAIKLQK